MRLARSTSSSIYLIAIVVSLFLSWDGALRGAVLNPDGICYLQSAAAYGITDFSSAMHLCGQAQWPFYSYSIYLFATLTKLSILHAGFILNALFSLISVVTFVYIAKLLGGNKRVLWLAAFTILLSHEFNSVREYIVRDHGFWAFYLISFAMLIQFLRSDKFIYALFWGLSLFVATLFRIEGAIFLLFVPLCVLFQFKKSFVNNFKQFLKLHSVLIVLSMLALTYVLTYHGNVHANRFAEVQYQLTHGLQLVVNNFNAKANALGQNVLSVYSARDAKILLFILLVGWFVLSVVTNASTIYALLFGFACVANVPKKDVAAKLSLYAYLIINLLICAMFLAESMFLSKRYLIALSLVIMMWVPFALEKLIAERKKIILSVVAILIFVTALGGIFDFGYSKQYISEAGLWLKENVPAKASLYSNDYQVMYYSHHYGNDIFAKQNSIFNNPNLISNGKWKQYDYLALRINKKDPLPLTVLQEISLKPVMSFSNKRGDQVVIFKVPHQENVS